MSEASLAGLRVLVVEDEMLISMLIEDVLAEQGCSIVGPFSRVGDALDAAANHPIDVALLDVNVAGTQVYPVAERLHARRIPFLLLSGYGETAIPADRPTWQACVKPFRTEELVRRIAALVARVR